MCVLVCGFQIQHILDSIHPSSHTISKNRNQLRSLSPLSICIPFLPASLPTAPAYISQLKKTNHPPHSSPSAASPLLHSRNLLSLSLSLLACCVTPCVCCRCPVNIQLWQGVWRLAATNGPSIYRVNRQPSVSVSLHSWGGERVV